MFKILKKSKKSKARLGVIKTAHGEINTPAFMPDATRGYVKLHDNADLEKINMGPMVVNTFHLYLQPGMQIIKKAKGIHGFMGWGKPLVSDSGGFQVFSLIHENPAMGKIMDDKVIFRSPINGDKHEFTPEKSIKIQFDLGADLIVCFDDCPPNDYDREGMQSAVARTVEWARRCKAEYDRQLRRNNFQCLDSRLRGNDKKEEWRSAARPALPVGREHFKSAQLKDMKNRRDSSLAARNDNRDARNDNLDSRRSLSRLHRGGNDKRAARYDSLDSRLLALSNDSGRGNDIRDARNDNRPLLIAVIQGGVYKDLRKTCADELKKIGFDGYGYGARPVDNKGKFLDKIINFTADQVPEDKIRFALGVGMPEDIIRSIQAGWDLFDCVIPTREGRHGRLFSWWTNAKKLPVNIQEANKRNFYRLENIINSKYKADFSPINKYSNISELRTYSKAYLHHLFKTRDPLGQKIASLNNLEFFLDLMLEIRNNIHI